MNLTFNNYIKVMNKTEAKLNQQDPVLIYKPNMGATNLPLDVESELEKYHTIYIGKEYDPFRIVHCFEAMNRDYRIYVETKEGDKKILFTSNYHYECCNCCEQCIIGAICCGYACCDSIQFQMDYKRNGLPFYTQGYNISKGCHCCDICVLCGFFNCIPCAGKKLYLRENIDPNSPSIKVGRPKGKTLTNCCCSCDKYVEYITENNLKGQTVKADCCDICKNTCMTSCCCLCNYCVQGCDFEMSIENEKGEKTGNVFIFSGCCSKKVEGKFCFFPRAYFEVNLPQDATSEQKFQIIADIIHLDLVNNII